MRNNLLESKIFSISCESDFNSVALEVFRFQANRCNIYAEYIHALGINISLINHYSQIPYLPISFFKSHKVLCTNFDALKVFESSKTTGDISSKHFVPYTQLYQESYIAGFKKFYGDPEDYIILALLPSYLERDNSSLVYMVSDLIKRTKNKNSGFFIHDFEKLYLALKNNSDKKILLIGVTYALLDFSERFPIQHTDLIVMETGGMKGRKKEMTRFEIHQILEKSFGVSQIHSEYGMTELLSQAYSLGKGIFESPQWMKVSMRDMYDPFCYVANNKIGGINIIDLANLYSCSFIETQDLGRKISDNQFVVEGRFDASDVRGCNLMYS